MAYFILYMDKLASEMTDIIMDYVYLVEWKDRIEIVNFEFNIKNDLNFLGLKIFLQLLNNFTI